MTDTNNECDIKAIAIPQETEAKRQFWEAEVKRWRSSGLTQKLYSENRGLPKNQLSYWLKKLEVTKQSPKKLASSFTPIRMQKERTLPCIRIKRTNGTCIELPLLSDMKQLKSLLEVLAC